MEENLHSIISQHSSVPRRKKDLENQRNFNSAGDVALAAIAAIGIATVAIVAPNALQAINTFFLKKRSQRLSVEDREQKTLQTFYYLKRSGLITFKRDKKGLKIFVTKKGRKKLEKMSLDYLVVSKPKVWDGKWWQVAADIPTKNHRQGADLLRRKLKSMGFCPLQRTLWFYPYDPRPELQFLIDTFKIANFVTVMEISAMDKEDENRLLGFFKENGVM